LPCTNIDIEEAAKSVDGLFLHKDEYESVNLLQRNPHQRMAANLVGHRDQQDRAPGDSRDYAKLCWTDYKLAVGRGTGAGDSNMRLSARHAARRPPPGGRGSKKG